VDIFNKSEAPILKRADLILQGFSKKDQQKIIQALEFAKTNHQGQFRKTGEPFIIHPIEVAIILTEIGLDIDSIIAAICHDLVEDSDVELQTIEDMFGETVAFLVDGVTKISAVAKSGEENNLSVESFQKLIIAAANDPRVLIIKLADRVHNLRTITPLPKSRQQVIAKETLECYSPLAQRIGMKNLQLELEDRSLQVIDPDGYAEADLIIGEAKIHGQVYLDKIVDEITATLKENNIKTYQVKSRVKSHFSVLDKIQRNKKDLEDIFGIRIITETKNDCYLALGIVHSLYPPKEESFDDYIAKPRSNLYQSLHTAVLAPIRDKQRLIEVQIRTKEMDDIAERGLAAHWLYKKHQRENPAEIALENISSHFQTEDDLNQAFQALKEELFREELYCLTPGGDVIILPKESTAIDFAYQIHSDLGDTITSSRVNGNLYPITKELVNEAVVEVFTNKDSLPKSDWLKYVKTNKAKQRIKSSLISPLNGKEKELLKIFRDELQESGQNKEANLPENELLKLIVSLSEQEQILKTLSKKESRKDLVEKIKPQPKKNPVSATKSLRPAVIINNQEDIKYTIAKCCNPEPTDLVIGYLSINPDRGVIIHKRNCLNIKGVDQSRLLKAYFQNQDQVIFNALIKIRFRDRPELLADIASTIYRSGAEIVDINLRLKNSIVVGEILCRVSDGSDDLKRELSLIEGFLRFDQ
jgi:guanosine-3',5'-bis(diphosphate) 3'-pyrophosphohydrolase